MKSEINHISIGTKDSFYLIGLGLIVLLISFLGGQAGVSASVYIGLIIAAILFWQANIETLAGIIVLYLVKNNFEFIVKGDEAYGLSVGGFPLTVELMACFFITIRVLAEIIIRPTTFEKTIGMRWIYLWLVAFIPSFYSLGMGFLEGNENWTRGFRFLMISGSVFYGIIFARNFNTKKDSGYFFSMLVPLFTIFIFLWATRQFFSHLMFFIIGFMAAYSVFLIYKKTIFSLLFAVFLLVCFAAVIPITSFTVLIIIMVSMSLTFLALRKNQNKEFKKSFFITNIFPYGLMIFSAFFTFTISTLTIIFDIDPEILLIQTAFAPGTSLIDKVIMDRLPFWAAATTQIIEGPKLFVASGRPLLLEVHSYYAEDFSWELGAHNYILECIRNNGLIAGGIIILIYVKTMLLCSKLLLNSSDKSEITILCSIIAVTTVGITTGDFPGDMTAGFLIWSLAGFFVGRNYFETTH